MIEEKITIIFEDQSFTFNQFVNDEYGSSIEWEIESDCGDTIYLRFTTEEQIQKVIDNLYRQQDTLRYAKQQGRTQSKT
jgi:hypothetical protein